MWLITTDGFFSAVEDRDDPDAVFVRARVLGDAEELAMAVGETVLQTPAADYRFRVRMTKTAWARYVADCAAGIDYDNFKSAVAARQGGSRAGVYGEVWGVAPRTPDAMTMPLALPPSNRPADGRGCGCNHAKPLL